MSEELDAIEEAIAENATGVKRMRIGNEEAEAHPVADQIAAAKFLGGQEAVRSSSGPLVFRKIQPPGAV